MSTWAPMNYSLDVIGFAEAYGLISFEDAGELRGIVIGLIDLSTPPEQALQSIEAKIKSFELRLSKNAYGAYLRRGSADPPLDSNGRLDWGAKREWEECSYLVAELYREEGRIRWQSSRRSSLIAKREALGPKVGPFLSLVHDLLETQKAIGRTKTSAFRRPTHSITGEDIGLCLMWADTPIGDGAVPDAEVMSTILSDFDARRLLSARAAEIAAADYYASLGCSVVDVSIEQLSRAGDRWRDFDLLVGGRPIDVKNARRSFSSPEHYVEHCVPHFKHDRVSNAEVSVVGVLSDYQTVPELLASKAAIQVLGEVCITDMRRVYLWMRRRFGHVLELDGMWRPHFQPGWVFEYPQRHYPDRVVGMRALSDLLARLHNAGVTADRVPGWMFVLCEDEQSVAFASTAIPARRQEVIGDLRSIGAVIGFSRPALYIYVMGVILEAIAAREPARHLEQALVDCLFFRNSAAAHSSSPLGLDDSQAHVSKLLTTLLKIQDEITAQGLQFVGFSLRHPSILRGKLATLFSDDYLIFNEGCSC